VSAITVVGNVVKSPERKRTQNGSSVTTFRVAETDRRFDSAKQEWIDASTFFVDVECWGDLGGNVSHSVSKGDPVIVLGNIRTDEWESEQGHRSRPQVKANVVALNLARGTADFRRTQRAAAAEQPATTEQESPAEYEEPADDPTREDFGVGIDTSYELDSENSSLEPARV
jgi:single stranded DNA-binding protein